MDWYSASNLFCCEHQAQSLLIRLKIPLSTFFLLSFMFYHPLWFLFHREKWMPFSGKDSNLRSSSPTTYCCTWSLSASQILRRLDKFEPYLPRIGLIWRFTMVVYVTWWLIFKICVTAVRDRDNLRWEDEDTLGLIRDDMPAFNGPN